MPCDVWQVSHTPVCGPSLMISGKFCARRGTRRGRGMRGMRTDRGIEGADAAKVASTAPATTSRMAASLMPLKGRRADFPSSAPVRIACPSLP